MPARSTASSTKPKRETKKPTTYVPGVETTIAKKTRASAKPKPKATPKKTSKRALKGPVKPAPAKRARSSRVATPSKTATPSKISTPKKAPKASPKKTAKRTSARGKSSRKGQPKYADMILEGLQTLHKKTGSSRQALAKYIEENYPERPDSKKWIRLTLHKLTEDGTISKTKGSYRLAASSTGVKTKPAKRVVTKKAAKAPKAPKVPKAPKIAKAPKTKKLPRKVPAVSNEVPVSVLNAGTGKPVWQFHHNGWKDYDAEASDLVEVQYQEWLNNNQMFDVRSVKSGSFEYNVDFRRNIQTNIQHPAHTEREIRRILK